MNENFYVGEVKLSYRKNAKKLGKVTCGEDAYKYLIKTYRKGAVCYKEYFKVLLLNNNSDILGHAVISEGGITATYADLRIIFQAALLANATHIIIAHNHPSGSLQPSTDDINLTNSIKRAGDVMNIKLLDHIILTEDGYCSFQDNGML